MDEWIELEVNHYGSTTKTMMKVVNILHIEEVETFNDAQESCNVTYSVNGYVSNVNVFVSYNRLRNEVLNKLDKTKQEV